MNERIRAYRDTLLLTLIALPLGLAIGAMDALLESAMNQNFIPVIDDLDKFIGIVTRRDIIGYLARESGDTACRSSKIG